MPTLRIPPYPQLEQLFALVAEEDAELLPACRWLVLGSRLGTIMIAAEEPTLDEFVAVLRLLRRRAPELDELSRILVDHSEHGREAYVEVCVDRLLESKDWKHPTMVLERPRPEFRKLLDAARARRKRARGKKRAEIERAIDRLEIAVTVADDARERRERIRRGRRR